MNNAMKCYSLVDDTFTIIEAPTLEQITQTLQSRHYHMQSSLTLYSRRTLVASPEHCVDALLISRCTRDRYRVQHVHYLENSYGFRHLIDLQIDGKERAVRYRADSGEVFTERFKDTVDFGTALRVALYFAENDGLPDDVIWDRKLK